MLAAISLPRWSICRCTTTTPCCLDCLAKGGYCLNFAISWDSNIPYWARAFFASVGSDFDIWDSIFCGATAAMVSAFISLFSVAMTGVSLAFFCSVLGVTMRVGSPDVGGFCSVVFERSFLVTGLDFGLGVSGSDSAKSGGLIATSSGMIVWIISTVSTKRVLSALRCMLDRVKAIRRCAHIDSKNAQ